MTDIKQLLTEFDRFACGQSKHTAFTELLDWSLLPFKKFDTQEEQLQAFETYKTHPKVTQLVRLIELVGEASEGFRDPLGELYQQAISSGHNGQYWTPEHLCDMMAIINLGDDSQPGQKICDPACGSGRMLLAAAKINRQLLFYGADLDITCCKMALLNMLLNSLKGEVAHMNTLSNEFYRGYKVETTLLNGYHYPYYIEFTDPEQSYLWLRPTKKVQPTSVFNTPFKPTRATTPINGMQGNLF